MHLSFYFGKSRNETTKPVTKQSSAVRGISFYPVTLAQTVKSSAAGRRTIFILSEDESGDKKEAGRNEEKILSKAKEKPTATTIALLLTKRAVTGTKEGPVLIPMDFAAVGDICSK
mgnify:CR=1 FL=1